MSAEPEETEEAAAPSPVLSPIPTPPTETLHQIHQIQKPNVSTVPVAPPVRLAAPARLLLVALGIGGAGQALFYSQLPGVGILLWTLLLLGAAYGLSVRENVVLNKRNLCLLVPPLLFFAAMIGFRTSELLTFWNHVAVFVLLGLTAFFAVTGRVETTGFWGFVGGAAATFGNALFRFIPVAHDAVENARAREKAAKQPNRSLPVVRGILLALPVLGVFIALLSSADAIFARYVQNVGTWLIPTNAEEAFSRTFLAGFLAWGVTGGLAFLLTRREPANAPAALPAANSPLGFVEAITVIGSVCALFGAFVAIQFAYLFGDSTRVLAASGLNYASYARKGFWELVVVACLTLVLMSLLRTFTRRGTPAHVRAFNTGGTLWVALTLVLLASAFRRMGLFEDFYGFTELRFYVDVFLFWLGAGLLFFVATLWKSRPFAWGGLVCAMGMLATVNLLGPDGTVARRNFARQAATGKNDYVYQIERATPDTVPVLCHAYDAEPRGTRRTYLGAALRLCLTNMDNEEQETGMPSWNLSRIVAHRLLAGRKASLPTQEQAEATAEEARQSSGWYGKR